MNKHILQYLFARYVSEPAWASYDSLGSMHRVFGESRSRQLQMFAKARAIVGYDRALRANPQFMEYFLTEYQNELHD